MYKCHKFPVLPVRTTDAYVLVRKTTAFPLIHALLQLTDTFKFLPSLLQSFYIYEVVD